MAVTLAQIVSNIRNTPDGGRAQRARRYSDKQIKLWVRETKNTLIYRDVKQNGEPSPQWVMDLGCVPLTTVDQADCPNAEWGEDVKKLVLPKVIDLPNNAGVYFFGLIDKKTRIYLPDGNYGDLDDYVPFQANNKRQAQQIGNNIYLYGKDITKLCWVNLQLIPDDPTEVTLCASENVEPRCYDPNVDCYPIPSHLEGVLYDMIFARYIDIAAKVKQDITNNELPEDIV